MNLFDQWLGVDEDFCLPEAEEEALAVLAQITNEPYDTLVYNTGRVEVGRDFFSHYDHVHSLDLSGLGLGNVWDMNWALHFAGRLPELKRLNLGNNEFTEMPLSIINLQKLMRLDLSGNNLSRLPEEIGYMGNLKELYAEKSEIFYVPETLGRLRGLQVLRLRDNKIGYLPESVLGLNPRIVDLSGNPLTCTDKRRLDIYKNRFSKARRIDCLFL
ncbi:MAG: leucine-rich repeat domain-containing protein [archaeon]